jgi:4-amino-4-deoxy-L-arabinose transferase-like glycosyltransferase
VTAPEPIGRFRGNWIIALLLFVMAGAFVISAQRSQGIARDEVVYMNYGTRYADWWIEFVSGTDGTASQETITKHFGGKRATDGNREHPPLMKTLFGLSERILHDKLEWTSETTGYRVPTALVNALLIAMTFLFVAGLWGRNAGLAAALLLLFLPRAFFHAGLATFDAPVVTFWFASLLAYQRSLRTRWGFLLLGLCAGLTLATKHNAILLPAVFLPHYAWVVWQGRKGAGSEGERLWRSLRKTRPQTLLGLFVVAPLVLIAIWPWMWFDTVTHVRDWLSFHFNHVHYNFEYLGDNWNAPPFPWHVAIVTTLFTLPLATLVAATLGFGVLIQRYRVGERIEHSPALLLFLSAGVAMGPFLLRTTPIFGAEKHWAPAIPSLCVFAGIGLVWSARRAAESLQRFRGGGGEELLRRGLVALVVTSAVVAAWIETRHAHPYSLSHYNALAGGAQGGANLGMNRQFWGYSARGVLPFINRFAKAGEQIPVYTHDASPAWGRYVGLGLLAKGMPNSGHEVSGIRKSKIAFVVHERHFNRHDFLVWEAYQKVQPSFVLLYDGVPLVSVYVRDELLDDGK